ncbi:DinB family protein [Macrococcus bovicus]|uniref:DinB family protein n=1 Tax=Macrococcus bovicus TaxID=69968 RepID=A0A4R6BZK9_9STAP|nr:DinB family protein [Macrococcus bovicus]TDM14005.1 DinB family protein [Macrococcus bovicus]WJP97514.1 DinB family protein [Macrococcus bovicus]
MNEIMNQISWQIESLKQLFRRVSFFSMEQEIYPGGRTCQELLNHIVLLPEADYRLSQGVSKEEIDQFAHYWQKELTSTEMLEARLDLSFSILKDAYKELEPEDLMVKTASYWGTTYNQKEWLLVILTHLSHHRSQLYTFLKMEGEQVDVKLFE